jgi:hypothetical protein
VHFTLLIDKVNCPNKICGSDAGADPAFQVRGAHLKKLRRAEGGAKFFFYFVWKITILRQKNQIFAIFLSAPP